MTSSAIGVLGETSAGDATPPILSRWSFLLSLFWASAHSLHIQTLLTYFPLFSCPCSSTSYSNISVTGEPHLTQVGTKFTNIAYTPHPVLYYLDCRRSFSTLTSKSFILKFSILLFWFLMFSQSIYCIKILSTFLTTYNLAWRQSVKVCALYLKNISSLYWAYSKSLLS